MDYLINAEIFGIMKKSLLKKYHYGGILMVAKEISRMNDYFARYLLSKDGNEDLLLSFINSVMRNKELKEFASVSVKNTFNLKEHYTESETILDVKAVTSSGEIVIIEVQVKGNETFFDRVLEYVVRNAKNIEEELEKEESENKQVKKISDKILSINLLSFKMVKDTKLAHTVHKFHCCETLNESSQRIAIHFLEIPKGIEGVKDKELQMWLKYFGSKKFEQEKDMIASTNKTFKKAVDEYDNFVSNDDFVSEYEKRQVFLYGQRIMLEREFEQGIEQGIKQGIEEGVEQVAKNALKEGLDIATIEKLTGLTAEAIKAIE